MRQRVLREQGVVIATSSEQNCDAVLNIDSLIYFSLNHHQTGSKPEWLIFSRLPVRSIISTVKQRGAQTMPLSISSWTHKTHSHRFSLSPTKTAPCPTNVLPNCTATCSFCSLYHNYACRETHTPQMTQCSLPSLHTLIVVSFVLMVRCSVMHWHVSLPWLVSLSSVRRLFDSL